MDTETAPSFCAGRDARTELPAHSDAAQQTGYNVPARPLEKRQAEPQRHLLEKRPRCEGYFLRSRVKRAGDELQPDLETQKQQRLEAIALVCCFC